jgi:hypothetical protein
MANEIEKDSLRQLKKIERELVQIKDRTQNPRRLFLNGILYGSGAFVGGVLAIVLVGWLLSVLGVIPGLSEIAVYLQPIVDKVSK